MTCHWCNGETTVKDTRDHRSKGWIPSVIKRLCDVLAPDGWIWRHRVCLACGRRASTVEVDVGVLQRLAGVL